MENLTAWIKLLFDNPWVESIRHPLVLSGFVLLLLVGLAKRLPTDKLSGKDSGKLYGRIINAAFVLAVLIVLLGLGQSFIPKPPEQAIHNNAGTAVNALGNVNQGKARTPNNPATTPPPPINQTIDGNQGMAINAGGNVQLNPPTPAKPETKRHAR